MEITYIGHACFKIKGKELSLVIDPYDPASTGYKMPKQSTDLVLLSHHHGDHAHLAAVSDYKLVVETPGEYELSDVFVYGFQTFHDNNEGRDRGKNTIFQIDIDGFSILHLGDLGHELSQETLEKISDTDVLLIPVGGFYTINADMASKVISSIEPAIVVPMHYQTEDLKLGEKLDTLDVFLKEMGIDNASIKKEDKLKLSSRADIPEETEIHLLTPQH